MKVQLNYLTSITVMRENWQCLYHFIEMVHIHKKRRKCQIILLAGERKMRIMVTHNSSSKEKSLRNTKLLMPFDHLILIRITTSARQK